MKINEFKLSEVSVKPKPSSAGAADAAAAASRQSEKITQQWRDKLAKEPPKGNVPPKDTKPPTYKPTPGSSYPPNEVRPTKTFPSDAKPAGGTTSKGVKPVAKKDGKGVDWKASDKNVWRRNEPAKSEPKPAGGEPELTTKGERVPPQIAADIAKRDAAAPISQAERVKVRPAGAAADAASKPLSRTKSTLGGALGGALIGAGVMDMIRDKDKQDNEPAPSPSPDRPPAPSPSPDRPPAPSPSPSPSPDRPPAPSPSPSPDRPPAPSPSPNKPDPFANVDWEATAARNRVAKLAREPGYERGIQTTGPGYSSEPVDQAELSKWYQRDGTGDNDKDAGPAVRELPPIEDRSRMAEPAAEKPGIDLTDKKYQRGTVGTRSEDEIEWANKQPMGGAGKTYPGPGWQEREREQGQKNWNAIKNFFGLGKKEETNENLNEYKDVYDIARLSGSVNIKESVENKVMEISQILQMLDEASKMADIKGKKHTGKYGKEYDTDEEGEEKDSKKSEPAEKKGRGRPKKDSTVDAGKWKGADDAAKHIIGGKAPKGKSNLPSKKHTLKDWIEHYENVIAESTLAEKAPKGWEGTVKAMKKHKDEIDNPWALAHWMKGKGYKSHKKVDEEKYTVNGRQVSKDVYDTHMKAAGKQPSPDQVREAKKADKDYDGDGKIESGKDEYQGSRIAAAKKAGKLKEGINFSEMMRETQMSIEEMLMELQSHIEEYKTTGHMSEALRDALDLHKYSKKDKIIGEEPMMAPSMPVVEEPVAEGPFAWAAKQADKEGKKVFKFGGETHPVTVSEAEKKTMSRHAKGYQKYGDGMKELAQAGKDGASEKEMDRIRAKHNKYSDDKVDEGTVTKSGSSDLTGTWSADKPAKGKPDVPPPVPNDPVSEPEKGKKPVKENNMDKQFESWANELDSLLNENITINTNTSSEGDDSVTVTATEGDAGELISLLRNAGMGGIFGGGQEQETSPYGAPMSSDSSDNGGIGMLSVDGPEVIDGGDSVLELIKKMAGLSGAPQQSSGEDYADEIPADNVGDEVHEPEGEEDHEGEEEEQGEEGSDHEDNEKEKEVDEAYGQADEGNEFTEKLSQTPPGEEFEIDGKKYKDTSSIEEGDDPMCNECGMNESNCGCDHVEENLESARPTIEEEFANEPTDQAMRDIEFMTNFITGGLNRQKRDQTTLPHTSVKVTESKSKDVLYEWKKLSGIK